MFIGSYCQFINRRSIMFRLTTGLSISAGITLVLFAIMSFLIKSKVEAPSFNELPPIVIDTTFKEKPPKLIDRIKIPPQPEVKKEPPPLDNKPDKQDDKPNLTKISFQTVKFEPANGDGIFTGGSNQQNYLTDGDAVPLVVIQPNYPRKPAIDGIEGWVKFKFTISADGTPKDIQIIDAYPKKTFERSAKKVIYKWKFKPKVIDGKAVEQHNMIYTMNFELSDT